MLNGFQFIEIHPLRVYGGTPPPTDGPFGSAPSSFFFFCVFAMMWKYLCHQCAPLRRIAIQFQWSSLNFGPKQPPIVLPLSSLDASSVLTIATNDGLSDCLLFPSRNGDAALYIFIYMSIVWYMYTRYFSYQ